MADKALLKLPSASRSVALASALAFGAQVLFALLMLKAFSPQAVGEFSVVSQIAFFWMTLSLAQTPLSLLANTHIEPHSALHQAWRESCRRALYLLPVAAVALGLSGLAIWPLLLVAGALALCQMAWGLAQSIVLRTRLAQQQWAVRVLPPFVALIAAAFAACWEATGSSLLASALLGYAVGASWLWSAWRGGAGLSTEPIFSQAEGNTSEPSSLQRDHRSPRLRLAHTLCDALMATALIVVWQRVYGAQETGWMSALLRVLGFVPAVVHMAWAQVMLTRQGHEHGAQGCTGLMGVWAAGLVAALSVACALVLHWGWLNPRWNGVLDYLWPLALWQASACVFASLSHRPFQVGSAIAYSWGCMGVVVMQSLALLLPLLASDLSASTHMAVYACVSALGLGGMAVWMRQLPQSRA